MKKFRLILHGALNGTAQGRAELIERLEVGLGLSRETAELLMSDLPRTIRDELGEVEASDLSFELESLGALVESEEYEVVEEEPLAVESPLMDPNCHSIPVDPGELAPLFEINQEAISPDTVELLMEQATLDSESPQTEEETASADVSFALSVDPPAQKNPSTVAESIHADLSSLNLQNDAEVLEIGFETLPTETAEKPRVLGFFDDGVPVSPPPVTAPAPYRPEPKKEEPPVLSSEEAIPTSPISLSKTRPPAAKSQLGALLAVGSALVVAAFAGFYAFSQSTVEPSIKISANVDALLKDQEKILKDDDSLSIPARTLRSWTRDFIQEEYQGKIVVDELPDGKSRIRINMKFLKPRRPSKEDLTLGRGSSEWLTTIQGELQAKPERNGAAIEMPVDGSVNGYLQGISVSSRKPVQISGTFRIDEKASQIGAKVSLKVKLKNLSPTAKTTQEPYSEQVQTLLIE